MFNKKRKSNQSSVIVIDIDEGEEDDLFYDFDQYKDEESSDVKGVGIEPVQYGNLDYAFIYLDKEFTIREVMKQLLPESVIEGNMARFIEPALFDPVESCNKWYRMWFQLCNPFATFEQIFSSCYDALSSFGEPREYKINPNVVEEELKVTEFVKSERSRFAMKRSKRYNMPRDIFLKICHADGKDRSNPELLSSQFYFSYLATTIEAPNIPTTTKIGSSKRPFCKLLYHHKDLLRGRLSRNTSADKYKFELFLGPFLSEDDARKFNKDWAVHRGAKPRREHAKKYASDRGLLCFDVRNVQHENFIETLRKKKEMNKTKST